MRHISYAVAVMALFALLLGSCDSGNPVAPKKILTPSFYPSTVGTYWVYADTTFDVVNSQVLSATTDSIAIIGIHRDTLGDWLVLNHAVSWVSDTFLVRGDTLFSRELGYLDGVGPAPVFTSAQYVPARDTAFVFNVLHQDILEQRTVVKVDSSLVCQAGTFSGCILYYEAGATEIVYRDVLAPNVGLVYLSLEVKPMGRPDIDQLHRSWLVKYHIAQ